jgi:enamine deaminase RidA (YjgF/YER057c/UK114 family)
LGKVDKKLEELGITLPQPDSPIANYVPAVRTGNLLFLAGAGPAPGSDGAVPRGKLGDDVSVDEGYQAARSVGLIQLARLKVALGDLDRIKQFVKLLTMVNSTADFTEQPAVANGCSDLLVEVFGDKGRHARSAVGMSNLPGSIPVEIEMIVEVSD